MTEAAKVPASDILRKVAKEERDGKLIPINEYKPTSFEYGETNPNALSDGDDKGKGETTSIGSKTDIIERSKLTTVNQFKESNPYKSPE